MKLTKKEADEKKIFGSCLRMARIAEGYSQSQLVKLLGKRKGASLRSLRRYEAGEIYPPWQLDKRLHQVLPLLTELQLRFDYQIRDRSSYLADLEKLLKKQGKKISN